MKDYTNITAPIFNIQSYSIHDGPGIRATVFIKGCPLRCKWCANPESNSAKPQLMTYIGKCTACAACVEVCPQHAINILTKDEELKAITNRKLCENCGACISACKNKAREIAGNYMSVAEILEVVNKDRLFIDSSGGGITLSGGEPLLYPDFSEALLAKAKSVGFHTAIESCSYASEEAIDKVLKNVDLALLDIKHMDSKIHKHLTGVPNEQILSNITHIHNNLNIKTIIRVPVIPTCNDSPENISATARFVSQNLGKDVDVHLLPYHRLGESKSESLGHNAGFSTEIPSPTHMEYLKKLVESYGLKAQIGG